MAVADRTAQRRNRERELVLATRALFDERGMQDAPIEEIAKAVGIARGLIYRQFASKEELFVLTVTDYPDELAGGRDAAVAGATGPVASLERGIRAFAGFCERYPAFLDCSLSLMQRPAVELHAVVSESVWLRLGQGMARCVDHLIRALRAGAGEGVLVAEDPELLASVIWTQVLGAMHLARSRVGIRQAAPGIPELFTIAPGQVVDACVASALATAGAQLASASGGA
jgi:AcrR family transcriptional regulator